MSDETFSDLLFTHENATINCALGSGADLQRYRERLDETRAAVVAYVDGLRRERDELQAKVAERETRPSVVWACSYCRAYVDGAQGAIEHVATCSLSPWPGRLSAAWCAGRDAAARLVDVSEDVPAKFAAEIRALTPPPAEDTGTGRKP